LLLRSKKNNYVQLFSRKKRKRARPKARTFYKSAINNAQHIYTHGIFIPTLSTLYRRLQRFVRHYNKNSRIPATTTRCVLWWQRIETVVSIIRRFRPTRLCFTYFASSVSCQMQGRFEEGSGGPPRPPPSVKILAPPCAPQ